MSVGKFIEHTSIHRADLSDDKNAEAMMKMFVNLPAEVITQGVSRIHREFIKIFYDESPLKRTIVCVGNATWYSGRFNHNTESMCKSHGRSIEIGI